MLNPINYSVITNKELPEVRQFLLERQYGKCKICRKEIIDDPKNQHVDHQHCTKSEELGVNGAGLIRGVLCRNCNAMEGKIWNNTKRYGVVDTDNPVKSRIEWLRNLASYYESNFQNTKKILHPKEKRLAKMSKSDYNALKTWFEDQPENQKRDGSSKKFPKYTGKWSAVFLKHLDNFERGNDA